MALYASLQLVASGENIHFWSSVREDIQKDVDRSLKVGRPSSINCIDDMGCTDFCTARVYRIKFCETKLVISKSFQLVMNSNSFSL